MLKSLFIQNYVLIDNLDIHFYDGLSVVTGETGAGKSIILGALSLVLGQRADASKNAKNESDKCVIEATFDISQYELKSFFEANALEYEPDTCLLRRELYPTGKSRAFVNDSPVSLSIIKDLGNLLIDIHSQHQNLLLGENRFQLNVIDLVAENEVGLSEYRKAYSRYQSIRKELRQLTEEASQSNQEADFIRFQLEQLSEARLVSSEQDELELELESLTHVEEIKSSFFKIYSLLNGDEGDGAVRLIKDAFIAADSVTGYSVKGVEIAERLRSAYIDLNDIASEVNLLKEDVEFDPSRLEWVNQRLDTIYTLERKHNASTVDELITLRSGFEERLQNTDSLELRIEQLKTKSDAAYQELLVLSATLSERRKAASEIVVRQLVNKVSVLGMPNVRFKVDITSKPELDNDGRDNIRFLFSANKSGDLQPIQQAASGGEISRLMLCLKAMIAQFTALPSIIFDEVDTGVSGDIADKMGDIMQELGSNMQVITITHLPQIAAKGNEHYFVYKQDVADQTVTRIKMLAANERVTEIARMLSGAALTEASIANAKDLLRSAE